MHTLHKLDPETPVTNSHCSVSEDHAGTPRIIRIYRGKNKCFRDSQDWDTITCHYCRHHCVRLSFYYRATLHRRPIGRCGRLTPCGSRHFKKSCTKVPINHRSVFSTMNYRFPRVISTLLTNRLFGSYSLPSSANHVVKYR